MSATAPARVALATAALLGFFSVGAQTILARELLVVFHGSELPLGVVLSAWLLLGAAGSALAGRFIVRLRAAAPALVGFSAAVAAGTLPCSILAARWSTSWLALTPGSVPGMRAGALTALVVLGVPAAACGAWFAGAAALGRDASGPGRAYAWEAVGGLAGGALLAGAFTGTVDSFSLSIGLATLTLIAAATIAAFSSQRAGRILAAGFAVFVLLFVGAEPLGDFARRSQTVRWPGLELVAARDGRHGNLALVGSSGQLTLFENGSPSFSFPDPESAEAATHLPLLAGPAPRRILIGGWAIGGALVEVLKHPVIEVDLLEPDPDVLPLVRPHLPPELTRALDDPRVRLHRSDLRTWLAAHPGVYDAILLGTVEPTSALANRLATREFFFLVHSGLRAGGNLALAMSAAPNYIGPELRLRNASVARALGAAFPRVEVLRDNPLTLLASAAPAPLADPERIAARLVERGIQTRTLSPEVLRALLSPERSAFAQRELFVAGAPENRDLAPEAYFHHARYRETAADPVAAVWLSRLAGDARWWLFALPAALAVLGVLPGRGSAGERRLALGVAATVTGGTAMTLQFFLLFVYQTSRGLLYLGLGMLSGVFMGGLAAGGFLALRLRARGITAPRLLSTATRSLMLLPISAGAMLYGVLAAGMSSSPLAADLLAGLAAAACAACAGFAFPLYAFVNPVLTPGTGGGYYAFELVGSAAGALLAALWLLPLLGLPAALAFLVLIQTASWLLLRRSGALRSG